VERNLSFEDYIQLLLSTRPLVVLLNKSLVSVSRHEQVGAKVSIPSACWSGYQVGSSGPPSETVGIAAISLAVQRATAGA
jgi:hypothetical protein